MFILISLHLLIVLYGLMLIRFKLWGGYDKTNWYIKVLIPLYNIRAVYIVRNRIEYDKYGDFFGG